MFISFNKKPRKAFFFLPVLAASLVPALTLAQPGSNPAERGQWMANMGESGLRGIYSSGEDLGELVNRAVSYRVAHRVAGQPGIDPRSRVESYVAQNDSLLPLRTISERPVYLRGLVRVAWRNEERKVSSQNDRLDLGLLYAPSRFSYVSVGVAGEDTGSDIRFVEGRSDTSAWGPRLDAGLVYNDTWAFAVRYDHFWQDGDSRVTVPVDGGSMAIERDTESTRKYFSLDAVARYDRQQWNWLPAGMQLRWGSALQYLHNSYSRQQDSLGQPVQEPFGDSERLGIMRTGLVVTQHFGEQNRWNVSGEAAVDYEFDTNMTEPIDKRMMGTFSLGVTRIFAPGQRLLLDYTRYENRDGSRVRDNLSLIAVFDF